jgi:hypothetical protein
MSRAQLLASARSRGQTEPGFSWGDRMDGMPVHRVPGRARHGAPLASPRARRGCLRDPNRHPLTTWGSHELVRSVTWDPES